MIQTVWKLKTGVVRQQQPAKHKADIVMAETTFRHAEFRPRSRAGATAGHGRVSRLFASRSCRERSTERNASRFQTEQMIAAATQDGAAARMSDVRHYADVVFAAMRALDDQSRVDEQNRRQRQQLGGVEIHL